MAPELPKVVTLTLTIPQARLVSSLTLLACALLQENLEVVVEARAIAEWRLIEAGSEATAATLQILKNLAL